jgi:hypothetical protein
MIFFSLKINTNQICIKKIIPKLKTEKTIHCSFAPHCVKLGSVKNKIAPQPNSVSHNPFTVANINIKQIKLIYKFFKTYMSVI